MKNWYTFKNLDSEAELSIYDEIGFWGTNASDFANQLKSVKGNTLSVHINSPGGNIIDGFAIYNMLKTYKGTVNVVIDGIAASIASVIAMAGKTIKMHSNALFMIHNPSVGMQGGSEDLRKMADVMDKMKEGMVGTYQARTKATKDKLISMMDDETWMDSKESQALGFCDEIIPAVSAKNIVQFKNHFQRFPSDIPSVGQQNKDNTTMTAEEQKRLDDALARIKHLEGEQVTAKNDAQQAANTEKKRRTDLKAYADKYNKNGDLNEVLNTALCGETAIDAFKDLVIEVVSKRKEPAVANTEERTRAAVAKEGGENISSAIVNKGKTDKELQTEYEACENASARIRFLNKNRAWAGKFVRNANRNGN